MRTFAALFGLALIVACGNGTAKPDDKQLAGQKLRDAQTADADPAKLEGAQLYAGFCANCHGVDLKGYRADNAPSLNNKTFLETATDDYLRRSIGAGRPGTSMAAYSAKVGGPFDDAAMNRLVAYLRSQGPAAMDKLPDAPPGDAAAGALIYTAHCKNCHGDAGSRGPAVHLANPQFLATATDAFIHYAIDRGRPGTPMEAFAGKLQPKQIADVTAFVRSYQKGGVAGEPQSLPPPTGKEPVVINPKGKDPVWKKLRSDPGSTVGRYVSVDDVKDALAAKKRMVLIDARPASDWMRVHITGAVAIPYHDMARLAEIPKDVWAIAYCACPHHLSGDVVNELIKRGHKRALVLDEGILEWHRRGYPVTAAPGVEPPPKETGAPMPGGHHGHSHHGHSH